MYVGEKVVWRHVATTAGARATLNCLAVRSLARRKMSPRRNTCFSAYRAPSVSCGSLYPSTLQCVRSEKCQRVLGAQKGMSGIWEATTTTYLLDSWYTKPTSTSISNHSVRHFFLSSPPPIMNIQTLGNILQKVTSRIKSNYIKLKDLFAFIRGKAIHFHNIDAAGRRSLYWFEFRFYGRSYIHLRVVPFALALYG